MKKKITTDPMEIKRIIEYYKQFYSPKSKNLDEINQFLERHNLPKLTQKNIHSEYTSNILKKLNQ